MKQKLLDFLGDKAENYYGSIVEDCFGVFVYGSGNFFSMPALSLLIEFTQLHGYHCYVSTIRDEVRFRIYRS